MHPHGKSAHELLPPEAALQTSLIGTVFYNAYAFGSSAEKLAQRFVIQTIDESSGTTAAVAFSGLSLGLTPTTSYWVVVGSDTGVDGSGMYWRHGGAGSSSCVSPNPTTAARFNSYNTPQWMNVTPPAHGMQVTAIPEPAPGNVVWNVPSGGWNVGSNWSGGLTPFASGTLTIGGTGAGVLTRGASLLINGSGSASESLRADARKTRLEGEG